jgi:phosphoribosylformylglycinamidine (FGAM) synthase PurS component
MFPRGIASFSVPRVIEFNIEEEREEEEEEASSLASKIIIVI